jgi:hypothetical protein
MNRKGMKKGMFLILLLSTFALLPGCVFTFDNNVRIKEVQGEITLFEKNSAKVIGHDGAYSIPLKDGRVFWTFGDTLIGSERKGYVPEKMLIDSWLAKLWAKEHVSMISNTGLFVDTKNAIELIKAEPHYFTKDGDGVANEIIPSTVSKSKDNRYRAVWPMDGIEIDGKMYVFYILVDCGLFDENKDEAILDINLYGTGLARSDYPYTKFKRLHPTESPTPPKDAANRGEYPYIWWNNEYDENLDFVPAFGTAVLKTPVDGYILIYGSKVEMVDDRIIHVVSLARVLPENFEDITKYEYLIGTVGTEPKWSRNPSEAITIFEGNSNELSVSYNSYLGKYVAVYSYAGSVEKNGKISPGSLEEIHLRTSEKPWGPWNDPVPIYKGKKSCDKDMCYAGKEHPEYSEQGGKIIYVTYVSHQRYFPELIRIELEKK